MGDPPGTATQPREPPDIRKRTHPTTNGERSSILLHLRLSVRHQVHPERRQYHHHCGNPPDIRVILCQRGRDGTHDRRDELRTLTVHQVLEETHFNLPTFLRAACNAARETPRASFPRETNSPVITAHASVDMKCQA